MALQGQERLELTCGACAGPLRELTRVQWQLREIQYGRSAAAPVDATAVLVCADLGCAVVLAWVA